MNARDSSILVRLAGIFDRSRGLLFAFVTLLTVASAWILAQPGALSEWSERTSDSDFLESTYETFDLSGSELFLLVTGDDLFSRQAITELRALATAVEELPGVERLFDLDDIPVFQGTKLSGSLWPDTNASDEVLRESRERALAHPLVVNQLLSEDAKTRLIPVLLESDAETTASTLVREIERAAQDATPTLSVSATGLISVWEEIGRVFREERVRFMTIGLILIAIITLVLFRNLRAIAICAGAPALGLLWTFGALSLLGEELHMMTSIAMPIMLLMIGFTDAIHLMVLIREERAQGHTPRESTRTALERLGGPCFLTSATTAVGFGSLMAAQTEFIQSFGRACAIGVFFVLISIVTIVPLAAGTRLGNKIHVTWKRDPVKQVIKLLTPVIDLVMARARTVAAVGVALTGVLLALSLQLRPEDQYAADIPDSSDAFESMQHIDRELGGIQFARVVISWREDAAKDSLLPAIQEVEALFDDRDLFRGTTSVRNLLESLPRGLASANLGALGIVPESITRRFHNSNEKQTLVTTRVRDLGAATYVPVFDEIEARLAELPQRYPDLEFKLTGEPVFYGRILQGITLDLVISLGMASFIIFVLLWIAYRSLVIGLISIIPNLFPLVVTGSLLYFLADGKMEISSVCAFTICLGIAVDDTIHTLSRFRRELAVDGDVEGAIRRAFVGVGTALLTTTFVLVCGFAIVLSSEIHNNRMFAAMGCSTIGSALVGDLLILPALLKLFVKSERVSSA